MISNTNFVPLESFKQMTNIGQPSTLLCKDESRWLSLEATSQIERGAKSLGVMGSMKSLNLIFGVDIRDSTILQLTWIAKWLHNLWNNTTKQRTNAKTNKSKGKQKMCMYDNKSTIAKFDSIFLKTKNYQIMNGDAYISKANILHLYTMCKRCKNHLWWFISLEVGTWDWPLINTSSLWR